MVRPKVTDEPVPVHLNFEARVVEMLDLIARASPIGRPSRSEMVRAAVNEFIQARLADAATRAFVELHQSKPTLRLDSSKAKSGT